MSSINTQKIAEYIFVSIIVVLAFLARTYRLNEPLADWHSWRQADPSSVPRRFVSEGIDLLHPRYDDLSSIPSGKDNPQGWRFVEFPIINALTAVTFNWIDVFSLEVWGRLTSIAISILAILVVYTLTKKYLGQRVAILSSVLFAFLPYNIYYHRTILPEVPFLLFSLLAFYCFLRWLDTERWLQMAISVIAAAIALLLKPFFIFMVFPMAYAAYKKWGIGLFRRKALYLYTAAALVPFIAWRFWATGFPEGIPANTWLLNGSGIRFRPAFFRWIFAERIGRLIFGFWGLLPFGLGLMRKPKGKLPFLFHWWLVGMLAYLAVFATGNVTHDYYQIFIIPPLVIFAAIGADWMLGLPKQMVIRPVTWILIGTTLVFWFGFSWFHIRDYFNINHPEIVKAGIAADRILPKNAKVIAPYQGDTAFLYQTNRQGWPIGGGIADKIDQGATDYVSVNLDDETKYLIERCKPSIALDGITIISLRYCSL